MGKRDRIKRVFKDFSYRSKASAYELASKSGSAVWDPRLNEPADRVHGAPSKPGQSQCVRVKDLWSLAFGKLSDEDKHALSGITSGSKLDILQHLHTAALQKQIDCENRRWKFELNGRQIILRDVAEKIIVWIDKFKQIGDIVANSDPIHASLPWAGIRFMLEMTVSESQQMGALLTGVEKITPLIGRCQIYETLYLKNDQSKPEWMPAVKNLMSALVNLYAALLGFLAGATRFYSQGIISRTLNAILNPAEVIGFINKCQTLENNVAVEVDNCERIHAHQTQANSEEQIHNLKHILEAFQTPILRTDSRVAALCEKLDSSERLSILEWISHIRYEENHFFACQGRTSGTGEWLLQHEKYRKWRASSASMILWLHGDPGVGKTKLVSTVVDNLLETFGQLPNDEAFAYFYCDRNEADRRKPSLILNSFVRQLSTPRNNDTIPCSIVQMYNQKRQTAFASGKLKLKEAKNVLADLIRVHPQVTLVVDALDECEKETRLTLIDLLDELITEASKPVKVLISSRQDRDIRRSFQDGPNLEIRAVDNRHDIEIFVKNEIKHFRRDDISSELKGLISNTLVEGSGGMFQWVSLQIAALRELCCERDIRNRLGKLPETLKTAYDELYRKIQSQKESAPIIANRAFQWVMCSCWPLSPAELVAAVCQDPDTDGIDEIYVNIDALLDACQNLLVVDQELNACRFSHLSVQEYFENYHWSSLRTNDLVGKVCLSLLISNSAVQAEQEANSMKSNQKNTHDILEYACLHWATHVQRLEESGVIENRLNALLRAFLGSMDQSSIAYQDWHAIVGGYSDDFSSRGSQIFHTLPLYQVYNRLSPCSRASLAVATFGFYGSIIDWWTAGFANVNQKNSCGDSLLLLGAMKGSVDITKDLLTKGAEVNTSDGEYGSALQAASYFGHESLMQLLLERGANVNTTDGNYGTALQTASYFGRESIVRLLLEKGAEVNASGGEYGSALQTASYFGFASVVQLLLDKGADVNGSGGKYGSALQAASFSGEELVVQILLDNGADVAASGGEYGSALQTASYSGFERVLLLLLDKGAAINSSDGKYGSALQAASISGYKSVVRLLLDKGADVNASDGEYGCALHAASYFGHESVVRLLLDRGADVNTSHDYYGSALQVASYWGHKPLMQLLLENGADAHAQGGKYGGALHAASYSGHESVVQLIQAAIGSR